MADPKDPYSWGPDRQPQHALPRTPTSRWIPDEDPQLAHHDPLPVKSTILDPSTDRSEWEYIPDPEVELNKYRDHLRDSNRMRGHDPNLGITPDVSEPTTKMSLEEAAELPVDDEEVVINLDELPPNYIKLLRSPKVVRKLFSEQQRDLADYMREAVRSARSTDTKPLNPGIVLRNWADDNRLGRLVQLAGPGDIIDPTTEEAIVAAMTAAFAYPAGIVGGGIKEGIKTSAAAVGLGEYIDPSLEGPNPEAIKVIEHHEEMIAKRLGEPFMIQLEEDIAMNIIGFVDLARLILGGGLKDEDWRGSSYGDAMKFFERGSEIGGLFANGVLAINYVVLKDLLSGNVEKLTAQPLTTAMVFYPVLKALKKAGRATPGMKRAIEALDNGYDRIKKVSLETANQAAHVVLEYPVGKILAYKYGVPPAVAKVMGKTFMMKKGKQAAYAAVVLAHWLDKSWWHFDRKWEKVLRDFQREEGSYKSFIIGRAEELARAMERGAVKLKIDPDGTIRRADGSPLTPEEWTKILDDLYEAGGPEAVTPAYEALGRMTDEAYEAGNIERALELEEQIALTEKWSVEKEQKITIEDPRSAQFEPGVSIEDYLRPLHQELLAGMTDVDFEASFDLAFERVGATPPGQRYTVQRKKDIVKELHDDRVWARERYQIKKQVREEPGPGPVEETFGAERVSPSEFDRVASRLETLINEHAVWAEAGSFLENMKIRWRDRPDIDPISLMDEGQIEALRKWEVALTNEIARGEPRLTASQIYDIVESIVGPKLRGLSAILERGWIAAETKARQPYVPPNVVHAEPLPLRLLPTKGAGKGLDRMLQREYVRYDGYNIPVPGRGRHSFTIVNEEWGLTDAFPQGRGDGASFTVTDQAIEQAGGSFGRAVYEAIRAVKDKWNTPPPERVTVTMQTPPGYTPSAAARRMRAAIEREEQAAAAVPGESPVVTRAREKKAELDKDPPIPPHGERQLQPRYRWDLPMKEDPVTRKIVYSEDHIKLIEDLSNNPAEFQEHLQRIQQKHAESIFDNMIDQGMDPAEAAQLAAAYAEEALGGLTPEQMAQIWFGERVPVGRVNTVFQDPFYQRMIDGIIEEIHKYFPEESWILNDVEPVMGAIRQVRTLKGEQIARSEVQTLFTSALRDSSTQLLRSEKLRLKIAEAIHKDHGVSVAEVNKLLKNMGESHLLDQPFGYEVTLANGESFNLFDAFAKQVKYLDKLDPGTMNGIRADVLRRIALHLGEEGSRKVFKKQMADEASRFAGTNPVQYTDAIFKAVLLRGEIPPNILKEYTPTQIANQLRSAKARYIKELMEATGMKAADAEAHVLTLASEIEKYKVPPTALGAVTPEGTTAVHKVFSDSMDWHLKSLNTLNFMDTWVHRLTNFMKVNLTARNIPTHIHNFVANTGHTGLRRGMTPLGVLNSLRKTGNLWESYKNGTLREINPEMYHMLREVESSGLLDTTRIEAEFGPRGLKGRLAKGRKPMQEAYRWGDNIFKLDETVVQLTDLRAQLNRLKPGEWAKVRTSKAKADAVFLEMLPDGEFKIRGGTKLSEAQLNKILVKASMEKALDIFFDYTEMSNFGKLLRAAPLMGVMSPFFSWFWKSLDIPFVKEGLVTKLVQSNDVILATNSTAINMQLAKANAALAARRAVVLSGIRGTLSKMSDDDRRKFFKRIGKDVGIILMENLEDPRYVSYQNWEAINFATSGLKLMRLGYEAYAKTLDPEDVFPRLEDGSLDVELKSIPEAERKDLRKLQKIFASSAGGHLADITDFLEVVGMSGTPLLDFLSTVEQAVQREAPIGLGEAYSRFGKALVGGVAHSASMVALGVLDPASPWGTRQFALSDDSREQEDATKWVVRTLFKWGWRQKRVATAKKKYMADFTRAMTNALDRPIDRRRKNLLKLGFKDEAAALKNKQRWINQIIKEEIKKMNRQDKANRNKYLEN